jgi:hypothetical protein
MYIYQRLMIILYINNGNEGEASFPSVGFQLSVTRPLVREDFAKHGNRLN